MSFSSQIYINISNHFFDFPQNMAMLVVCSWHFFCQIRPFFDNFVIFKPKLQQFIRLIFSFLSYSREIYNSISTHFIDFPQNIAMRVLWFLRYFCKKDYFFVILSFSNQNYDSISVFLLFLSQIYVSILTHFIDFPKIDVMRALHFCQKIPVFVTLSFSKPKLL